MSISILYTGTPKPRIIESWEALGLEIIVQPLFSYQGLTLDEPELATIDYIVISSQRAVQFLGIYLQELFSSGIQFYVVGHRTAEELRTLGIEPKAIGESGFSSLKSLLPSKKRGVFFGAEKLAEPASLYLSQNPLLQHCPVYQQQRILFSFYVDVEGIVATSPRAIECIAEKEEWKKLPLFVLGETSVQKAELLGFSNIQKAPRADLEGITLCLEEYFRNEK
jgi:uroporphyrinogen-III synthase